MTLNITDKEAMVLKSLIIQEIDFLDSEIKQDKGEDKKELIEELNACNEILTKLNK